MRYLATVSRPYATNCGLADTVLMIIAIAGRGMEESPSFANLGEAAVMVHHMTMRSLVKRGVEPREIAIVHLIDCR